MSTCASQHAKEGVTVYKTETAHCLIEITSSFCIISHNIVEHTAHLVKSAKKYQIKTLMSPYGVREHKVTGACEERHW